MRKVCFLTSNEHNSFNNWLNSIKLKDREAEFKDYVINELEKQMYNLAKDLEFEKAAKIRDQISELQRNFLSMPNRQKS